MFIGMRKYAVSKKKKKLLIAKRVNFANQSRVVNFAIMLSFPDENVV
jgi:hypothetical protein